jgi:imidazolonepropionase-like amidohydrolase
LLLGSDAFGALVPGFAPHQELELMVAAGLSPYEALRTGTVNVAAYLGEVDSAGTVEIGKRADFTLVAANPLDDIRHAAKVRGVFSHAKWHSATELEARIAELKAAWSSRHDCLR